MAEISVKIKVGNRVYPLTVDENDKDRVEQAAQIVNGNINKLRKFDPKIEPLYKPKKRLLENIVDMS